MALIVMPRTFMTWNSTPPSKKNPSRVDSTPCTDENHQAHPTTQPGEVHRHVAAHHQGIIAAAASVRKSNWSKWVRICKDGDTSLILHHAKHFPYSQGGCTR